MSDAEILAPTQSLRGVTKICDTELAGCPLNIGLLIRFCAVSNKAPHWYWLRLTWVEDGTCTALDGPGLWVKGDISPLDLHLTVLVQDLFDLDLHLCVGAFVVSGHHL